MRWGIGGPITGPHKVDCGAISHVRTPLTSEPDPGARPDFLAAAGMKPRITRRQSVEAKRTLLIIIYITARYYPYPISDDRE